MTSKRELMQKVFHNEPAERVPVGFWFHFLTDDQLNSAVAHPELMEKSYAGHKAYIEAFDPDFVKIMTDGLFCRQHNARRVHGEGFVRHQAPAARPCVF